MKAEPASVLELCIEMTCYGWTKIAKILSTDHSSASQSLLSAIRSGLDQVGYKEESK